MNKKSDRCARNAMRSHLAHLLAFVVLAFGVSACGLLPPVGGETFSEQIEVMASEGWQSTEILIRPGDELSIVYLSGKWSPWPGGEYDAIGSGGDPRCRCNVMEGVSHAALIGRVGDSEPFLVGDAFQRIVGESGILWLAINDVDLYDNTGSLTVLVGINWE